MLMTIDELRIYVDSDESDEVLMAKLSAIEMLIRQYTHNNFQERRARSVGIAFSGNTVYLDDPHYFKVGDTVTIDNSITVVTAIEGNQIEIADSVYDAEVLVTKVVYPNDIKMGALNMLKWDLNNRHKVGIQSETISRHAVTYFSMDGDNASLGYPKSLIGFLKPYKKARF